MTLRLKGSYQNRMLNILVDSGSSYNFIKPCVAHKLALPVSSISPFKVFVGSGDFIWCQVISLGVPIMIQGVLFLVDLHHLEISGANVVFGVSWMKGLGRVLTDYNKLTIEFLYEGKHTILFAEKLLKTAPLNGKYMRKLLDSSNISSLCQFQLVFDIDQTSSSTIP